MPSGLDIILIPVAYVYVFGIIYLASKLKSRQRIDGKLARKIVHLGIGLLVIVAPLLFSTRIVPVAIGLTFILITFFTCPVSPVINWRIAAFSNGHGLGTVYYSLSLTSLLYLFFDTGWIIQLGFLPLVFGDAFANIIGLRYGKHKWLGTSKSAEGTLGGFVASVLILIVSLTLYYGLHDYPGNYLSIILISLLVSLVMAIVEIISPFGTDNITIPLFCTVVALIFANQVFESCVNLICGLA